MLLAVCLSAILLTSCHSNTANGCNADTALADASDSSTAAKDDAATAPFTAEQYNVMVEFFNCDQESDLKKPFDKWAALELPGKIPSSAVVYAASNDCSRGAFYYVYNDGESVDMIVSYAPPMKFSFWTASADGGTIGLTANTDSGCTSYWTYAVNADKEPHYVFAKVCNGKVESAESTTETTLDPEIAMQTFEKFDLDYDPVGKWHPIPATYQAKQK